MKYSIELIRLLAVVLITFTHTRHTLSSGKFFFIIEEVPRYGTVILSLISGYLFWKVSKRKKNIFSRKLQSLIIPYLIANLAVLIPVLIINGLGYNFLNRLTYDYTMITEGIFSLNSPPINPPTYFIRDIFMVFVLAELILFRNYKMFFIILPFIIFGELMLRYDILLLFILGILIAQFRTAHNKNYLLIISCLAAIASVFLLQEYSKYFLSTFIFLALIDANIKFYNIGAYSYLLHLYHSPIMVASYPILNLYIDNIYLLIIMQIVTAATGAWIIYLLTRRFSGLRILSGGR